MGAGSPSLQEVVIQNQPHSFTVTSTRSQAVVEGRKAAVETARRMSRKTWDPVRVERADERVTMSYHRGDLMDYRRDPRRRRKKS